MPSHEDNNPTGPAHKGRLGELLIKNKLITQDQLEVALKRRTQIDLPLGSILIEMGLISADVLLDFLSERYRVPSVNLFNIDIPPEVLRLISYDKMQSYRVLPIKLEGNLLTVAMVTPQDFITISDLEFTIGKKIKPVIVPFFIMEAAHKLLSPDFEGGIRGKDVEKITMSDKTEAYHPPKISSLFNYLVKSGASDMLLTAGVPPSVKQGTEWRRLSAPSLTPKDCEAYAAELLSSEEMQKFQTLNEMEIGMSYLDSARFRITLYRQRNSIAIAIRHLYETIPSFKELNLPEFVNDYALKHQGLIIVGGPAGSGKSTTLATMINIINTNRHCNIISLEEPIEFLHKHQKSNVNQREIGRDTQSFEQGLRSIFRMAPDVIVIGELRDRESFEIALRAARTGHLVIATMHAFDATSVIRTMINMFPVEQQKLISMMLAESMLLSLYQRLIQKKGSSDMILATEKLTNSSRIKKFIWEGKIDHIRSQLEAGAEEYTPIDYSLAELCKKGEINFETGLLFASNETLFRSLTGGSE